MQFFATLERISNAGLIRERTLSFCGFEEVGSECPATECTSRIVIFKCCASLRVICGVR